MHDPEAKIFYIVMNTSVNLVDFKFIEKFGEILDKIEATKGPGVIVTISRGEKVFSAGFNVKLWAEDKRNSVYMISYFINKIL